MAESRAERKARRALIEAAEGSEEKKSSKKSKSAQDAKGKSAKGKAKAKRPGSRRNEDKASQTRSKHSHKDRVSSARKAVDPKSPCSIMKACGGCTALNRPYKKQLAAKQAAILKAEAEKQAAILKADGEAQAIMAVQKAMADSLALLNEKAPNDQVLKLKALEAMQKVADGKATKIIIPSELQGFAGLASGIAETVKETK